MLYRTTMKNNVKHENNVKIMKTNVIWERSSGVSSLAKSLLLSLPSE